MKLFHSYEIDFFSSVSYNVHFDSGVWNLLRMGGWHL